MEENKLDLKLALRSEKARSIIGEIPSSLVRYGLFAIAITFALALYIATNIPYRKVYKGTCFIERTQEGGLKPLEVSLRFDGQGIGSITQAEHGLILSSYTRTYEATLQHLSHERDGQGRQKALIEIEDLNIPKGDVTLDFTLSVEKGSILSQILGRLF